MTTIEKMAKALAVGLDAIHLETSPRTHAIVCAALVAYEEERELLQKTVDWHEHGTVAPSCVGCPTAEAMIEKDMVFVRTEMIIGTIKVLVYIMESDKSEKYEYGESRANGDEPKAGQRFLTPSEIALGELAHLHGLGFTTEKEQ